jgi:hypothetical protein
MREIVKYERRYPERLIAIWSGTSASHGSSEENQTSNRFNYIFAAPLSVVDIRNFKSPNRFFSANCSESN